MRDEKGLSAEKVAQKMGISRPFYTQLEGGKRWISVEYLEQIARILGVSVSELYREEEPPAEKARTREYKHIRPINSSELRKKLESILGKEVEDFVDCCQL